MSKSQKLVRKSSPLASAIAVIGTAFLAVQAASAQEAPTAETAPDSSDAPSEEAADAQVNSDSEYEEPEVINLLITVPRGDVNQAQARQCEEEADAASISGDIIVCRQLGEDGSNYFSGSRKNAQKRYAQETAFAGDPQAPEAFGIPNHGNAIGFGSVPPPALIIDVEALPEAPPGSDADRIARGLPPLGDRELTEEEEKARREALGGVPNSGLNGPE